MRFKKTLIRLIFIGSSIFALYSFQKNYNDKTEQLTFRAVVDRWETIADVNYLLIKTTLTNFSSDTVAYITMSCSWQEAYATDTKDLVVVINECVKNVHELIKIPPKSRRDTVLKLISQKSRRELKGLQFRVGFNFVSARNYDEMFSKASQLTEMKNVIWSDTLKLN